MPKLKSPLLPIFLIVLVDVLGLAIILPLLPFYAERFGATPNVVGLLVSSYAFCQLIAGPILGQISDRTGRKPLLLVSQVGTFAGFILLANSTALWMVFLSRVIDGVTAGNLSLAQAYISDVTEPQNRAKAFGLIGISFGLGFLVGPGISGYLSQFGYHYPIYAAAALSALSILATATLLPSRAQLEAAGHLHPGTAPKGTDEGPVAPGGKRLGVLNWGNYLKFFRQPDLARVLFQFSLFSITFALFTSGFALFSERRFTLDGIPFGPKQVGYIFAYSGMLGVFLQGGVVGRLVKKHGERKVAALGFASNSIAYGVLAFSSSVPTLLISATFGAIGNSTLRPSLMAMVTQKVGRHQQGVALGLTQSIMSLAQIITPLASGLLIEHGYLSLWALFTGLFAVGGLALALKPLDSGTEATAPAAR